MKDPLDRMFEKPAPPHAPPPLLKTPEEIKEYIGDAKLLPPKGFNPPPMDIDLWFQDLAQSTEFKRLVYLIWKGKVHRGKKSELNQELNTERRARFGDVMREMKENKRFLKRKEVSEK